MVTTYTLTNDVPVGSWFNEDIDGLAIGSYSKFQDRIDATSQLGAGSYGSFKEYVLFPSAKSRLKTRSFSDIYLDAVKKNWIKWSGIGSLDFTINKGNVAGERPLDWKGQVYVTKKLGGNVIAYGENGVSVLAPSGTAFGLNTIYRTGLKSKNAIAGDDFSHFFIDKKGQLWKHGESLERLDYSEYLSQFNNNLLVMLHDNYNNLIYMCDGSIGYVYNPVMKSLGTCQPNITGIAEQNGNFYVTASGTITQPAFEICTDVYDFGTKEYKTINSLDIGADIISGLSVAIDYKRGINDSFFTTSWTTVPNKGRVFINAFGTDFRFRLKSTARVLGGNFNALGQTVRNWQGMTATPGGNVYACVYNGDIYMQTAGAGDFVALNQTVRNWRGMTVTSIGNVYACVYGGDIYMQTGGVGDFVALGQTARNWMGMATHYNGNVYACVYGGDIYMQTGGVGDFVALGQTTRNWQGMVTTSAGNVYAGVYFGDIYMQTLGAGDFVALNQTARDWRSMASPTGPNNVYACVSSGDIYMQTAGVGNFNALNQTAKDWRGMTDAPFPYGRVYACVYGGDIYMQTHIPASLSYISVNGIIHGKFNPNRIRN